MEPSQSPLPKLQGFTKTGVRKQGFSETRMSEQWGLSKTPTVRNHGYILANNQRKRAKPTKEQTLAARVKDLEHELAYTRQEVEFLKKIHLADLEARKSWESKHRRK